MDYTNWRSAGLRRGLCAFVWLCVSLAPGAPAPPVARARQQPKLVLVIVIDQFRYDYLTRFRSDYRGGLDRLLNRGAVFTNARFQHFPTVTAVGHSTVLTGATPALSGIVNNEWFDRESGTTVTSVSDKTVKILGGGSGDGASPGRLLVSTVGDELKMSGKCDCRVVGMSLKDRAAILPAGHMADGAYWFDGKTGNFLSSTFYFPELPGWVKDFNAARNVDRYAGAEWRAVASSVNGNVLKKLPAAAGPAYYDALEKSPFGNDLLESFAERGIDSERLGSHPCPDLLSVSFSSIDLVGHDAGPDSPEVRDLSVRLDAAIGKLFKVIDSRLGLDNVMVVLTADHGVVPVPEVLAQRKMPGGRMVDQAVRDAVQTALAAKYGEGKWILYVSSGAFYLNRDLMRQKNLNAGEVRSQAAQALGRLPHVFRVYTWDQLEQGWIPGDVASRLVENGFNPARSADVTVVPDPYWSFAKQGTTHGSPFGYDNHVPVVFMGPGIKPGRYDANIAVNDIAPTLATILDVETPSGSAGRVLTEMMQ